MSHVYTYNTKEHNSPSCADYYRLELYIVPTGEKQGLDYTCIINSGQLNFLLQDSAFEFEKKRNVPVKYDRELWSNTVRAMKRIEEIKNKRQDLHIKNRLKPDKQVTEEAEIKEIKQGITLIAPPVETRKLERKISQAMREPESMETEG